MRPLRPDEVVSSEALALENALRWLRALPFRASPDFDSTQIGAGKMHPIKLTATFVPDPEYEHLASKWRAHPGPGCFARVDGADLQEYVDLKAKGLQRYARPFDALLLLLVAEGSGPGSYLALEDGTLVDPRGFDAVFFQGRVASTVCTVCVGGTFPSTVEAR